MKFLAFLLTMSVGLGCTATRGRDANSPDDEDNDEVTESQGEDSDDQADDDNDDDAREAPRPPRRRKPTRPRHVETAPEPELPPMYRKPLPPPPVEPLAEETSPAPAALTETTDQGGASLEAEARKRCHWKKVPPYRPEWANSLSPPLSRKITSKPICPYGTPPAVLHAARQIAVQQTKLKQK